MNDEKRQALIGRRCSIVGRWRGTIEAIEPFWFDGIVYVRARVDGDEPRYYHLDDVYIDGKSIGAHLEQWAEV